MAALDAGVPLRDVQIAARHADPRTTTIYDRRRQNFDRHAEYVVVAFVAGGRSWPSVLNRILFGSRASSDGVGARSLEPTAVGCPSVGLGPGVTLPKSRPSGM
jgi:hypothetical protein